MVHAQNAKLGTAFEAYALDMRICIGLPANGLHGDKK